MKKKLNCVLLIDDDENCNFYHRRILKKVDCVETIAVATNGKLGVDCLTLQNLHPELIFLDVNMPVMNGWEFLDEFEKIKQELNLKSAIIMVSTTINPDDIHKAKSYECVKAFNSKFLNEKDVLKILEDYFPEYC